MLGRVAAGSPTTAVTHHSIHWNLRTEKQTGTLWTSIETYPVPNWARSTSILLGFSQF